MHPSSAKLANIASNEIENPPQGLHSFRDILIDILRIHKPDSIIEWGPGLSTELMLKERPEASIVSIEHSPLWYERARSRFGNRIRLLLKDNKCRNSSYATCAFDHGPYDLAFIDGRRRVECILAAAQMLNPQGLILLHDCDRQNYILPIQRLFITAYSINKTAILRPKF